MTVVEKAQEYYSKGLWSKQWLRNLVAKGKLTVPEYVSITGEDY